MLKEKIQEDLRAAMKSHNETAVSTLRMILAAVKNKEIEKRGELTDAEAVKLLAGEKKKHLESIAEFAAGGRADLADKEKAEAAIVEKYLPAAMPDEELRAVVARAAAEAGGDFGKAMKAAMAAAGGRADGRVVSALVKEALEQKPT